MVTDYLINHIAGIAALCLSAARIKYFLYGY